MPDSRLSLAFACLATVALTACGNDDQPNTVRIAFAQRPPPTSTGTPLALRFPTESGEPVRLYQTPALDELTWRFDNADLSTESIVGFSIEDDMVFFRSPAGALRSLELASGRVRTLDTLTVMTAIGPTNRLFIVRSDSMAGRIVDRRFDRWPDTLPALPERVWGTTGERLVAVFRDDRGRYLTHLSEDWGRERIDIPDGAIAVSEWGDFVAVAAETEIVGIRLRTPDARLRIPVSSAVTDLTFSASAHRLYYLLEGNRLHVVNRFDFEPMLDTVLAGQFVGLEADPFGRYLLGRPESGDSVVVFDATDGARLTAVAATWDDDLPATTPDGTVLVRQGADIVAVDPRLATETGRRTSPAGTWVLIPWDPSRPTVQLAAETEPANEERGDRLYYAQLGSTSNLAWAQDRVDGLVAAGLPARVLMPGAFDDRYRLALGPYNTRVEAEDNARLLGQAYFIISFDRSDTTVVR